MKKSVLFLCTVCLLFAVSCASEVEETFDATFDSGETTEDFQGMTFKVMYDDTITGLFAYAQDTQPYDELSRRITDVEKKYKFTLGFADGNNPTSYIPSMMAAGLDDVQFLFMRSHNLRTLGDGGYLTDVAVYSDIIDYTDSFRWGARNALEILTCKGVLCGVAPVSWIDNITPYYFAVISNNSLLRKNGIPNLHDYEENGEWTRDKFIEIIKTCNDPVNNIYGFESYAQFIYRMAVHMNGVGLIDETSTTPRSAWHSAAALEALEWAYNFTTECKDCIAFTSESIPNFFEGRAALALKDFYATCKEVAYDEDVGEFSVMPFPGGENSETGKGGGFLSTNLNCVSIPVSTGYIYETATIINEIFAPIGGIETTDDLKNYYASNIFYDSRDVDTFFNLAEIAEYCYWPENHMKPIENMIDSIHTGKNSPAQAIEQYLPQTDEVIVNYIIPNREGFATYFPD